MGNLADRHGRRRDTAGNAAKSRRNAEPIRTGCESINTPRERPLPPMSRNSPPRPLILASSSPYRRQLLERLGLPFRCSSPDIDERPLAGETAPARAGRLAEAKARAVADMGTAAEALIIGSDQVAQLGDEQIGKPGSHQAAVAQLERASGQTMNFFTGLCLLDPLNDNTRTIVCQTSVTFLSLERAQIENYLRRERPYDCAGACKVEGLGISLLASVRDDDPTALIGLPLISLCRLLREAGLEPLAEADPQNRCHR